MSKSILFCSLVTLILVPKVEMKKPSKFSQFKEVVIKDVDDLINGRKDVDGVMDNFVMLGQIAENEQGWDGVEENVKNSLDDFNESVNKLRKGYGLSDDSIKELQTSFDSAIVTRGKGKREAKIRKLLVNLKERVDRKRNTVLGRLAFDAMRLVKMVKGAFSK